MILGTFGGSMLGNMLMGKGVVRDGKVVVIARRGHNNNNMDPMDKNIYFCSVL